VSLQPARELRDKRTRHGRVRAGHVGDRENQAFGIPLRHLRHQVRPIVGAIPVDPVGGDPKSDAPEILDERQAQHDGHGPQFAQIQDGDGLVGCYEAAETLRIHPSVAVRDGLQGDVVYARKASRGAAHQARQLPAEPLRQMPPGHADLLFDQIEVVEEPVPGWSDAAVCLDRLREEVADASQNVFVLSQPRQEEVARVSPAQPVGARQGLAVLLHLVGAEQLRPKWRLIAGEPLPQPVPAKERAPPTLAFRNGFGVHFQFRGPLSSRRTCAVSPLSSWTTKNFSVL
jgi:hypothetical protein